MVSLAIWWCGILLEGMLLFRGLRAKLFHRYPNFYIYVLGLFLSDGLLYVAYALRPKAYLDWVWYPGFLVLFLGCGIVLEIFRHALSRYAGVEKLARTGGLLMLGVVLCFAVLYPIIGPSGPTARNLFVRIQRDFLTVQAILLFCLVQLVSYYGIPLGRNLKGMILGYGQCIGVTLVALALQAYIGTRFEPIWSLVQQLSYLGALGVWLITLWSYWPDPLPQVTMATGGDYDALASRTRDLVGAAGTDLMKVERL